MFGLALTSLSVSSQALLGERPIIPTPLQTVENKGLFQLKKSLTIGVSDHSLLPAAQYLKEILSKNSQLKVVQDIRRADIVLKLSSALKEAGAYRLEVRNRLVVIEGADYPGLIAGISSFRQLAPVEIEQTIEKKQAAWGVPAVTITDAPRFQWRGVMLDASRHFWTTQEVKRVLDLMALYKLNKFHWHLTDDQGWRIEIKAYPLLTQKGAWRKLNNHDLGCIDLARKTDNPDYLVPEDKLKIVGNDTLYGGYYTQEEIKEIVAYAGQRGIDVIPEIDMPGHFLAAISQYPEVACDGMIGWGNTFSSPICPGKDSALDFCKTIYKEVFALFPYQYVHLGGDEVEKKNWERCSDCQQRIKKEGLHSTEELQAWFVCQMEKFFLENKKQLIGWDEVVADGLSNQSAIMWWRSWVPNAVAQATADGKEAICSPNFCLYFDYQQDKNSLKQILDYEPLSDDLTPAQQRLVKGVQGNIWTEWIPSMDRVEYMMMPRLCALGELAWCKKTTKSSLDAFHRKLVPHFKRMDVMAVNYRILDLEGFYRVNAFVDQYDLKIQSHLPNAVIRYTTDGTMPTKSSALYTGKLRLTETTDLKFRTFRPDGSASDLVETRFVKAPYTDAATQPTDLASGLRAVWHDYKGNACSDLVTAPVKGTYTVEKVSIPQGVKGNIGLVLTGFLEVPADGIYTFALTSDDGSMMALDGEWLADNDGPHSPREIIAQKALRKGLHPVEIRYFDSNGGLLRLEWINAQGEKEEIPAAHWKQCVAPSSN
ncbi:MAG: beta-N-acetylhexosaminidase [Bacteroidia bacterium]|nr:beta-N-acetylhexosaminidase [Bacteroidia bacterium]